MKAILSILGIMLLGIFISCKNQRVRELEHHLGFELENDFVQSNIETRNETNNHGYFINVYDLTRNEIQMIHNDPSWNKLPSSFRNPNIELVLNDIAEYRYKYISDDNIELILNTDNGQLVYSKLFE